MRTRAFALVLTVVGAALSAGCSGGPEAAAPSPSPSPSLSVSASPTRTPTPTSPPEPTPAGELVALWYKQDGSERYNELAKRTRGVHDLHEQGRGVIDFENLSAALRAAEAHQEIPDAPTQAVWANAQKQTRSGMADVLSGSSLALMPLPEDEAREAQARGWEKIGKGLAELKDLDARFRAVGIRPDVLKDPWAAYN